MSFIFRTSPGPPGLIPLEIFSGVEAKLELGAQKFFFRKNNKHFANAGELEQQQFDDFFGGGLRDDF